MPETLFALNPAEAIFAPFHDPQIAWALHCAWVATDGRGVHVEPSWCYNYLGWDSCPVGGVVGTFTLTTDLVPGRYDALLLCLAVPATATVQVAVCGDDRWTELGEPVAGTDRRAELSYPLPPGTTRVTGVRLVVRALGGGCAKIALSWFGLADRALWAQLARAKPAWDPTWPGLLVPVAERGPLAFTRGLLFAADDLPRLRHKKALPGWQAHFAVLEAKAWRYLQRVPEDDLGDYLPWSDVRYLRGREQGREPYFWEALILGLVGLVNDDAAMCTHAVRYLLCMVHTTHWCQSAESRLPGSTWDQRCFLEEMTTTSVALLLDWFGHALTPRARELVRQALWDKGLAIIERDTMKFEYVHHMNQGPWFDRAKILAGLLLEQAWPRLGDYTDRAFREQRAAMNSYILPDGGTDEGIGYFSLTMTTVLWSVLAYARARQVDPRTLLPQHFAQCGAFLATMSAVTPGQTLMDGDQSTDYLVGDTIPILAGLFPDSPYARIAARALATERPFTYFNHYVVDGLMAFVFGPEQLLEPQVIVPTFARLEAVGQLTSLRPRAGGGSVRLHLSGCKASPSHSHLDKGAFTLEVDGVPCLIDRGTVRYDDARGAVLMRSALHNCLTPVRADGSFPDQARPTEPVTPHGEGDAQRLDAWIDLRHVWREEMDGCVRELHSHSPTHVLLLDGGRLRRPGRLAFHLHALRPFELAGTTATLPGQLRITAPWAVSATQYEDLINYRFAPVYHLVLLSAELQDFDLATTLTVG